MILTKCQILRLRCLLITRKYIFNFIDNQTYKNTPHSWKGSHHLIGHSLLFLSYLLGYFYLYWNQTSWTIAARMKWYVFLFVFFVSSTFWYFSSWEQLTLLTWLWLIIPIIITLWDIYLKYNSTSLCKENLMLMQRGILI